jgi:hypothetical protein
MGGREECGYMWNAKDTAPASKTVDAKSISLAIDAVGAQQDSLDACSTVKMGRLLRQEGVPYQCSVPPNTVTNLLPVSSSECSVIGVFL